MYKTILITGASSGIGKALAEFYAASSVTLILTGRDVDRLKETQKSCEAKGAKVITKAIDVTDQKGMDKWLNEVDKKHPLDLLIANAGVSSMGKAPDRSAFDRIMGTNFTGVLNTVWPVMQRMKERKAGHIAVVSSLTAYRGYPRRGPYCTSKAAVKMMCECWRIELEPFNVFLSTIFPGFIRTPLTDANKFKMPLLMEPEQAAEVIARGLVKKKAVIAFPWPLFFMVRMLQCLPVFISDWIVRRGSKGRA